ncbi:hypothetical protein M3Y95_00899500 [Aphelenchoides besseyi]|nr:hypothetical protein M3Y95_00899500 [Aphelenchoides besseyi]
MTRSNQLLFIGSVLFVIVVHMSDAMVITTLRRFPPSHGPYYRTVFPKRALDELEGTDFGMKRKRALDMLEGSDFGMRKRSLDLLDGTGFGFDKRALDALEGTDFIGLKKRALDMLDGSDFGMRKRALDMLDGSDFGMRKRALDSLEGSGFGMKKRAVADRSASFFRYPLNLLTVDQLANLKQILTEELLRRRRVQLLRGDYNDVEIMEREDN